MKDNLIEVIKYLGFEQSTNNKYEKTYINVGYKISIDLKNEKIEYPEGITVHDHTTCNFDNPENFVVLECVDRLLEKGYRPEHLELERKWSLGHEKKSGKADICVLDSNGKYVLFIVECKTAGTEYKKARKILLNDGGQLFSYWQQERSTEWLILYASDFVDNKIEYFTESISCKDDSNIVEVAKKDTSVKLYKDAYTTSDLFEVWKETYEKRFAGDVIFRDDSTAYKIGIKPLRKSDLKDFGEKDKIVNKFEEILRHNNVSDKENAFNRLIALFIAKLVDEIQKSETDIVEFQYKIGTDTYETLQDRLQRLHKEGMERFMREEIYYVADDYAEQVIQSYTGQKRTKLIEELKNTIRVLKFYTNNDFAFKDVHNEELFYQNGKILVEMVQLFENYRIIGSNNLQMLGDMFEQLLNKGFKQNEGQFFTPVPITRFIWAALPISSWMNSEENDYPKIIDYACGAGHFLTEGVKSISSFISDEKKHSSWVEKSIYGIEKDYRLARVSKISLFMHGAGDGNIIFGDGLDNYPEKEVKNNSFDILVANPPYSVSAFKPHLNLKNNNVEDFSAYPHISNEGKEIEVMFTERISQLLKAKGIAAVILPSPILNKEQDSFVKAREIILKNFNIRAICNLGDKTFGATGTNTVILFLEKFSEPPIRKDEVYDSVQAIFENQSIEQFEDKEIYNAYLTKIGCPSDEYVDFIKEDKDFDGWENNNYFSSYYKEFITSTENGPKLKQKSFKNLSEDDKKIELNRMFYTRVKDIEKEKM